MFRERIFKEKIQKKIAQHHSVNVKGRHDNQFLQEKILRVLLLPKSKGLFFTFVVRLLIFKQSVYVECVWFSRLMVFVMANGWN